MHSRKSVLFNNDSVWTKRNSEDMFDITMGSFDGAEICELVGSYILSHLSKKLGKENTGLYRDDGLAITSSKSARQCEKLKKELTSIFHAFDLRITIQANIKTTNFLDVTFNLENASYQPYSKPNNQLLYVDRRSNHPPTILEQIPTSVNSRISSISDCEATFKKAAPDFEKALKQNGHTYKMKFEPPSPNNENKRKRSRQIIWYNPPFNKAVKTNIGRTFLNLIKTHFLEGHRLHKLFNKNNVKEHAWIPISPDSDTTGVVTPIHFTSVMFMLPGRLLPRNDPEKIETPNFDVLISDGSFVPNGIVPTFITKTLPNHFTIATGLYEESHGIVANDMYDPVLNEKFHIGGEDSTSSKWWDVGAEPIWVTNQKHGGRTGVYYWPGSETEIMGTRPNRYKINSDTTPFETRIDDVIDWFTDEDPINLGLLYFNEPDHTGQTSGPESDEILDVIRMCDDTIGYLIQKLQEADLYEKINILITSDHGMTELSPDRLIQLDDYVNPDLYDLVDSSPVAAIYPFDDRNTMAIYNALLARHPNMTVYLKDSIPDHFHYKHNRRIMPIIAVADEGGVSLVIKPCG
ncbi:bis(5'-adenosyl)-triphosphatase ENPP4-like [Ptychodera flava]|uniref:bis(5'-adenosyl)-triphosphatase ENPP4-like n=1 Tax=Ptychodera flava TaxID=63121 RepID=UPI003969DE64